MQGSKCLRLFYTGVLSCAYLHLTIKLNTWFNSTIFCIMGNGVRKRFHRYGETRTKIVIRLVPPFCEDDDVCWHVVFISITLTNHLVRFINYKSLLQSLAITLVNTFCV